MDMRPLDAMNLTHHHPGLNGGSLERRRTPLETRLQTHIVYDRRAPTDHVM